MGFVQVVNGRATLAFDCYCLYNIARSIVVLQL